MKKLESPCSNVNIETGWLECGRDFDPQDEIKEEDIPSLRLNGEAIGDLRSCFENLLRTITSKGCVPEKGDEVWINLDEGWTINLWIEEVRNCLTFEKDTLTHNISVSGRWFIDSSD